MVYSPVAAALSAEGVGWGAGEPATIKFQATAALGSAAAHSLGTGLMRDELGEQEGGHGG